MKYTIELDPTMYFTNEGMGGCIFFNDTDDGVEFNMTWDELIENEFEMQTIPTLIGDDKPQTEVVTLDAVNDLHTLITAFEDAAKKMRTRLTEVSVLDRQAWLKANDGAFNHNNRDEFTKPFSYDMVKEDVSG